MREFDVVIVGAGIGGIYALYRIRQLGLSAIVLEAGGGVGGTWYWNRYPGARCDVESVDYSFSFSDELQQEWTWSEKFAAQPEILRYINHVVDRFDLRNDIELNRRVGAATYDEAARRWTIEADDELYSARYFIMATGILSIPLAPALPGLENFKGETYYTGLWPEQQVQFAGKKVGVVGTGSSGVQVIPVVAQQARHLTVFQRTASYSVPAHNVPMSDEEVAEIKDGYVERRQLTRQSAFGTIWSALEASDKSALEVSEEEREREYEARWASGGYGFIAAFADLMIDMNANKTASDFVRRKIREIVRDPATAERLVPKEDLPIGCKRLCISNGYLETFNRDNVTLVHLPDEPLEKVEANGIRTTNGLHELDMLILAAGFDALSGAVMKVDIKGVGGAPLRERWADGPRTFMGIATADFPNFFMINGPHSVAGNIMVTSEPMVEWVVRLIDHAERTGIAAVDATPEAEDEWLGHVAELADLLVATASCNSWWNGGNVPGKPRIIIAYLGGLAEYTRRAAAVEQAGYKGLRMIRATEPASADA